MKKLIRRVSAAVLSLAIVGGAMPYAPSLFKLPDFSLTANAASGYSYDSTTKVMTGQIQSQVTHILLYLIMVLRRVLLKSLLTVHSKCQQILIICLAVSLIL